MWEHKQLRADFTLARGSFSGGGNNLSLSGLRMSADFHVTSGPSGTFMDSLVIYGMSLSQMNQLSLIGKYFGGAFRQNELKLYAGEEDEQLSLVFQGVITQAYIDGNDMPNVRFIVTAAPGAYHARKPVPSTTKRGAVAGEDLISQLAGKMGFKFENNSVHVMLRNPYLWGTAISQVAQAAKAMDCLWSVDRGTLAIWKKNGARQGSVATIAPPKMVGYPVFSEAKIFVRSYYDPTLLPLGKMKVQNDITAANATWNISDVRYELDCLTPHGRWFMVVAGLTDDTPSSGSY